MIMQCFGLSKNVHLLLGMLEYRYILIEKKKFFMYVSPNIFRTKKSFQTKHSHKVENIIKQHFAYVMKRSA